MAIARRLDSQTSPRKLVDGFESGLSIQRCFCLEKISVPSRFHQTWFHGATVTWGASGVEQFKEKAKAFSNTAFLDADRVECSLSNVSNVLETWGRVATVAANGVGNSWQIHDRVILSHVYPYMYLNVIQETKYFSQMPSSRANRLEWHVFHGTLTCNGQLWMGIRMPCWWLQVAIYAEALELGSTETRQSRESSSRYTKSTVDVIAFRHKKKGV